MTPECVLLWSSSCVTVYQPPGRDMFRKEWEWISKNNAHIQGLYAALRMASPRTFFLLPFFLRTSAIVGPPTVAVFFFFFAAEPLSLCSFVREVFLLRGLPPPALSALLLVPAVESGLAEVASAEPDTTEEISAGGWEGEAEGTCVSKSPAGLFFFGLDDGDGGVWSVPIGLKADTAIAEEAMPCLPSPGLSVVEPFFSVDVFALAAPAAAVAAELGTRSIAEEWEAFVANGFTTPVSPLAAAAKSENSAS